MMKPSSPTRFRSRLPAVFLLLAVATCGGDSSTGPVDITDLVFAAELGVNLSEMTRSPLGAYYKDLVVGEGEELFAGDRIRVHYASWLHDGHPLDDTRADGLGSFMEFYGVGRLIAGWDDGLRGMRVGGERLLVVPPHLAYGSPGVVDEPTGTVIIPPNATLVFRIELLEAITDAP